MSENKTRDSMDRRTFLKSTAAIGAGLAFAPSLFAQAAAGGGTNDINVALLGAGEQGKTLLASAIKIPGVRFKAVCDIWEYNQKPASRLLTGIGQENNAYVDYKEMLDKEKGKIDAVLIATPDFWHAEHTIACLEAGLHVYCEKEMSNTLEGAKKMVEAQRKTGKLLQIGHQRRSNPRYIHCYEKLLNSPTKVLGDITAANGQWNRAAREFDAAPKNYQIPQATLEKYGFKDMIQFRNWRWFKGLGGGPIVDLGSHQIDIFSWFLRCQPKAVVASGGTDYYDKKTHEWYDTVMTVFEYPSEKRHDPRALPGVDHQRRLRLLRAVHGRQGDPGDFRIRRARKCVSRAGDGAGRQIDGDGQAEPSDGAQAAGAAEDGSGGRAGCS